jgi:4-hydroxy-3-polyprenylbenzoate decarboxylase
MTRRIIVGLAGASGVIYGVRLLSLLKEKGIETHLIISKAGKKNIEIETHYNADEVAPPWPTWR